MNWNVGIGITNQCNLKCSHCYSRSNRILNLSLLDVKCLCDSIRVGRANLGTGESILNLEFRRIMAALHDYGIPTSLTSNGLSISFLDPRELALFNDIDISIEFPNELECDSFRGHGVFEAVHEAVEKCKVASVPVSLACCIMNINYKRIPSMLQLAQEWGVLLRANIYKPVAHKGYSLSYEQYWEAIQLLLENSELVACSEPLIVAALGLPASQGGCGRGSLRVTPEREIVPCVYWLKGDVTLDHLFEHGEEAILRSKQFKLATLIPEECRGCPYVHECRGGCVGRRLYSDIHRPDPYCFYLSGGTVPPLRWRQSKKAATTQLIHASYLCSIIVDPCWQKR
ncbi:MAG: putative mycofactocin radical SAM maturase MftC [Syntrophomonadaceae bacterium]|nr:putative mycofactocin radical SAM maturase MftC [Bacillota bacterium]MBT9147165.1 putative mycofactocin radical SAM maturase MftC [Bacillota bacterium]